jgi:hypothetical protein
MIRLHVVAEGQTEERFVNQVLRPHLAARDVFTDVRCVETSRERRRHQIYRGGLLDYRRARADLARWMKQDDHPEVWFTTMFDLYALPEEFPGFADARARMSPFERVEALEASLPAETSQLEASIRALAKVLDKHKDRVDEGFDVPAQLAAAPGLAESVRKELAGAEVAKAAPVADTREIDLLDGKLVTWMARLNKTARRAFKDAGDDVKAKRQCARALPGRGSSRAGTGAPDRRPWSRPAGRGILAA